MRKGGGGRWECDWGRERKGESKAAASRVRNGAEGRGSAVGRGRGGKAAPVGVIGEGRGSRKEEGFRTAAMRGHELEGCDG